jgi:hypothetical protein
MKKALNRKEDRPQSEELPTQTAAMRSAELLAQILADDFCEFGSSEVIGALAQQNFAG